MYPVTQSYIEERALEVWHPLLAWIAAQSQDVWGWLIYSVNGHMSALEDTIEWWMIDQPYMARANAVRLFHQIFDWELYLGTPHCVDDAEHGGSARLLGLRTLAERLNSGFYAETELGLPTEEIDAYFYKLLSSHHAKDLNDPRHSPGRIFDIPDAALTAIPGRPLDLQPDMVEPPLPDLGEDDQWFCEEYRSLCRQMSLKGPTEAEKLFKRAAREKSRRLGKLRAGWRRLTRGY